MDLPITEVSLARLPFGTLLSAQARHSSMYYPCLLIKVTLFLSPKPPANVGPTFGALSLIILAVVCGVPAIPPSVDLPSSDPSRVVNGERVRKNS